MRINTKKAIVPFIVGTVIAAAFVFSSCRPHSGGIMRTDEQKRMHNREQVIKLNEISGLKEQIKNDSAKLLSFPDSADAIGTRIEMNANKVFLLKDGL